MKFAIETPTQTPEEVCCNVCAVLDRINIHPQRIALAKDLEGLIKGIVMDMTLRRASKEEITAKVQTLILVYGTTL
jgi:hypothetical protein